LVYALIIAAASATSRQSNLVIVLGVGTLLTSLVSLTVWRAFVKLDINLKIIHRLKGHVEEYIQNETEALGWKALGAVNPILGKWIPLFCTLSLAIGVALAWFKIITAG